MKSIFAGFTPITVAVALAFGLAAFDGPRLGVGLPAAAAQQSGDAPAAKIDRGYVYVMRGLGNIWSRGMDKLAEQLEAKGVRVHLDNHRHWKDFAAEAVKRYESERNFRPIIIIGHSLGANAAILMASKLGESGVPVRLIVTFDGLAHTADSRGVVSHNVEEVLNFYNGLLLGMPMIPGKGFTGTIENVDIRSVPGAGHIKVDKNPELQARAIDLVMEVLGERRRRQATN